jgi:hypothetical protein
VSSLSCDSFFRFASKAFEDLKTKYGFREVETSRAGVECWMTLRTATVGIRVAYEPRSPIWVELLRLEPQSDRLVIVERSSLDMLLDARRAGGCAIDRPPVTESDLDESLMSAAANLRRFGADLLAGDFGVFPRLKELEADNLRKRSQELFGDSNPEPK